MLSLGRSAAKELTESNELKRDLPSWDQPTATRSARVTAGSLTGGGQSNAAWEGAGSPKGGKSPTPALALVGKDHSPTMHGSLQPCKSIKWSNRHSEGAEAPFIFLCALHSLFTPTLLWRAEEELSSETRKKV